MDGWAAYALAKAIKRSGMLERLGPMRWAWRQGRYDVVFVAEDQLGFFAPFGVTREVVPWCMDSWPKFDAGLHRFFTKFAVRRAGFTQRAAAARCREALPEIDACWMPECTPQALYDPTLALADRPTRVIAYGRQLEAVAEALTALGDPSSGVLDAPACRERFADLASLRSAIGEARTTVAYPRSVTHAGLSGGSETMTLRYLEAVASRTVLLGHGPREMADLFGFDPVIAAGPDTVGDLVRDVAEHPDRYQDHVDRCHARYLEVGTTEVRARQFAEWLRTGVRPYDDEST